MSDMSKLVVVPNQPPLAPRQVEAFWMDEHQPQGEEHGRFRAEAGRLLGVGK
jgi:hypothetical protein